MIAFAMLAVLAIAWLLVSLWILAVILGPLCWLMLRGIADDLLVVVRLKYWPATGRAVWRWRDG